MRYREQPSLFRRCRVWYALRCGRTLYRKALPRLVGDLSLDSDINFEFLEYWERAKIVEFLGNRRERVRLVQDLGPRPPSWHADHNPNLLGEELDPRQRLWTALRVTRMGYQKDLLMVAGLDYRRAIEALRGWQNAGLLSRETGSGSGRALVVTLRNDLGAIAPLVLDGRVYDPNSDQFIIVPTPVEIGGSGGVG